nr:RNA-directed DNA polymerase, eukaryota, reverse transcriptase zinc-binding domain protein [Tanacetum cinerariifolium]
MMIHSLVIHHLGLFSMISGMDDDLFTYEVEIPGLSSIPCNKDEWDDSDDDWDHVPLVDQFPRVLSSDLSRSLEEMKYWSIVGNDVILAVKEFFSTGFTLNGCNPSFIALIPKVLDVKLLNDFRPISLVWCQYKIIGKIIANRLSYVIDDLISQEQSAFVKGRQIMKGPIILNEVISWCKTKKEKALLFKVDFQKAFDSFRWDHLDDILDKFRFGQTGLRQGDPLSLFLFILVMESLQVSFQRLIERGGRLTLVKSVLGAIPTYYMSLFKVPMGALNRLWLKTVGGLGVHSMFALNHALLFKWIWRFKSSHSGLWINVIKAIHGNEGSLNSLPPYHGGSVWLGIIHAIEKLKSKGIDLLRFCNLKLGNGPYIRFWIDKWYGEIPFQDKFNRCFNLELQKDVSVAVKFQGSDFTSSFRRRPRWFWSLCGSVIFTVKSARELIDKHILATSSPTRWSKMLFGCGPLQPFQSLVEYALSFL